MHFFYTIQKSTGLPRWAIQISLGVIFSLISLYSGQYYSKDYTVCSQDAKFGHLDYPNTLKISQHCLEVGEYFRQYNEDCRRSPDVFFTLVFILKFQSCSPMKCLLILKTPNPIQRLDSGFLPMCSLCLSTENVFRRKIWNLEEWRPCNLK